MHEMMPITALRQTDSRAPVRREFGLPALLILLGMLLAYSGGLVRAHGEAPGTYTPVSSHVTTAAPGGLTH